MSGFVGIVNRDGQPVDGNLLSTLTKSLAFRGPDGLSTCVCGPVGFGLAQLQTNGERPVTALTATPSIVGDVRLDGRQDLIHRFDPFERSYLAAASDVELVLRSYRRWGDACLSYLAGDFSFAIWDSERQRLFCARDQFGVKPFFYSWIGGCLVFSNTLECIRAHPDVPGALDELSLADFLVFGAIQDPSATSYRDIRRLPAAHSLVYEAGSLKVSRYWTPNWRETPGRYRAVDIVEEFREVLGRATADRLTSPQTSLLMSGGLDSTAVAAVARRTGSELKAFTVVYDRLIPDEERRYAGEAASYLEVPIEYLAADNYQLFDGAVAPVWRTPEPADEPLARIAFDHLKMAHEFSSVALSGQGGDAIFAIPLGLGVGLLRAGRVREFVSGAWRYLRLRKGLPPVGFRGSVRRALLRRPDAFAPEYPDWLNPELQSRFGLHERWKHYRQSMTPRGALEVLQDPFWPMMFESYDAGVTGIPLDVRHPFFDLRIIAFCMSVNPLPWCIDKTLLRVAMRGWLPASICERPKAPVMVDPVEFRLNRINSVGSWKPSPALSAFVRNDMVPSQNLRPRALSIWLDQVDRACGLTKGLG